MSGLLPGVRQRAGSGVPDGGSTGSNPRHATTGSLGYFANAGSPSPRVHMTNVETVAATLRLQAHWPHRPASTAIGTRSCYRRAFGQPTVQMRRPTFCTPPATGVATNDDTLRRARPIARLGV